MNHFQISKKEALFGTGEVSYLHNSKLNASCAFEIEENSKIFIKLPRAVGATRVRISVYSDESREEAYNGSAIFYEIDGDYDVYSLDIQLSEIGVGLYFYNVYVSSIVGEVISNKTVGNKFSQVSPKAT